MEVDTRTPATFKTTISQQPFYYFQIALVTESAQSGPPIDMVQLRSHLATTLNQWLGASGGGTPIDILKFDGTTAIIRVPFDDHRGVWQALTVATFKMAGTGEARFQVLRNSAFAMGVAASSRATYKTV